MPALLKAAEAGHSWAQLRLAEHYSHPNGSGADRVTAYMWCLLSQETAASMSDRIEKNKTNLVQSMSAQELSEAEQRASEWKKNTDKKSRFAEAGDQPRKKKT